MDVEFKTAEKREKRHIHLKNKMKEPNRISGLQIERCERKMIFPFLCRVLFFMVL